MDTILVSTYAGCRLFSESGECGTELDGQQVSALASGSGGTCLAVVNGDEIWRRSLTGAWSKVAAAGICVQSLTEVGSSIFCGGMDEAVIVRISAGGSPERLPGFDAVSGRGTWFAGGPPLGVRSMTSTVNGAVILAAVHVGGVPRSEDGGARWTPTIPIMFDVHEVRGHASMANLVAAACAVGLCVSHDGGKNWKVFAKGLELTNSLAVAVLDEEVLFGISDGPFAKQSQVWRWRIGEEHVEQVGDGLPEWLEGKIDAQIAAGCGRAAVVDGGGNLWLSQEGSTGWSRIATDVRNMSGMLIY